MPKVLTDLDVLRLEHRIINESVPWESLDNDTECRNMMAYVSGINDFAETLIREMKKGADNG